MTIKVETNHTREVTDFYCCRLHDHTLTCRTDEELMRLRIDDACGPYEYVLPLEFIDEIQQLIAALLMQLNSTTNPATGVEPDD